MLVLKIFLSFKRPLPYLVTCEFLRATPHPTSDPPTPFPLQYSDVAGIKYPAAYQEFLGMIDLVNCDLGFILSFACIYDTNFYDRLLMATLGPVIIMFALGCTYVVAVWRNRASEEAVATVKNRHLSIALFVIFVVYATVSHTILETFVCDTLDDGNSYLRADYSLTCTTARHVGFQVYAALMVVVYPVGFPCAFGWWLFKHRQELKCEEDRALNPKLRPAADLWEPYRRQRYYYEVRRGETFSNFVDYWSHVCCPFLDETERRITRRWAFEK